MTPAQRETLAADLRQQLESRRDTFVISQYMFEPQPWDDAESPRRVLPRGNAPTTSKTVSAACLRLLLDYCESTWEMDFVHYCAGVFHGREPAVGETAFDLLPEVQARLSADRLGLGHIYGGRDDTR